MKTLTVRLKEAENRAEQAEKSVKRLQKEVDRLEGNVIHFVVRSFDFRIEWKSSGVCNVYEMLIMSTCIYKNMEGHKLKNLMNL